MPGFPRRAAVGPKEGEHGVDALTALVAGLVASLRTALAAESCPGGWPWAVTVLGIGVGLLPTAGAVLVAVLRKRIGSRYGAGESVLIVHCLLYTSPSPRDDL